jgi:pimeloyl-ACP methyl ester carboxylesterase
MWRIHIDGIRAGYSALNDAIPTVPTYPGETLFVLGGKSRYVQEDDKRLIRGLFPAVQFRVIEHAHHWVHADAPDQFIAVVASFLIRDRSDLVI